MKQAGDRDQDQRPTSGTRYEPNGYEANGFFTPLDTQPVGAISSDSVWSLSSHCMTNSRIIHADIAKRLSCILTYTRHDQNLTYTSPRLTRPLVKRSGRDFPAFFLQLTPLTKTFLIYSNQEREYHCFVISLVSCHVAKGTDRTLKMRLDFSKCPVRKPIRF